MHFLAPLANGGALLLRRGDRGDLLAVRGGTSCAEALRDRNGEASAAFNALS